MNWLDWLLVAAPIVFVLCVAIYTQRYVRSVADFLSGGRCAGRYLLANARGESDSGLSNTMSKFEIIMISGFVLNFWEKISVPVLLLVGISGFVVYRFRETRAMTLAQFLEARYSRKYRLFMGSLAFLSGILNYGIYPAISARFFIYFLELPSHFSIGPLAISTFAAIMTTYLTCTVFMVLIGGQVTLMVTDCIEGILSHAIYILIVVAVFWVVGWGHIVDTASSQPPGKSMIDPFNAHQVEDFNLGFAAMALLMSIYTTMALQNKQGFNSAARTPHESRMGGVLGHWRGYARGLMLLVLGLCAVTYLRHPDFSSAAAPIHQSLQSISDPYIQKQMTVPVTLSHMLPPGIKGLFVAIMIMGLLAGDSGHIHSWGSILVQDVILPLRKNPLSTRQHIWALRLSVTFVAAFALTFSLLFTQSQYITLWWALTAGVFTGGAGAAIIGGLYWKRGTTSAAWAGTLTGCILNVIGIMATSKQMWPIIRDPLRHLGFSLPDKFWFNGQQTAFASMLVAIAVYVVISLLGSRRWTFDLDRMLHRGVHAIPGDGSAPVQAAAPSGSLRDRFRVSRLLRFDSNFTRGDKLVSGGIFWWAMLLLVVNVVVSVWNLFIHPWPTSWWSHYWMITAIALPFAIALATLVWFGIGGIIDIQAFFHSLRTMQRDSHDDGRVEVPSPAIAMADSSASPTEVSPMQTSTDLAAGVRAATWGTPPIK